jgi:hypothetical protein
MEYDELLSDIERSKDDDSNDGDATTAYITQPYINAMKRELALLQQSCKVFTAVDMIPDDYTGIDSYGCTNIDSVFVSRRTRRTSN